MKYLPIDRMELPNAGEIDLKGLIVITGPNSSGKTQLMRDINAAACGEARKLVVASRFHFSSVASKETYLKDLLDDELCEAAVNDKGKTIYKRVRTIQPGSDRQLGSPQFGENDFIGWYQDFRLSDQWAEKIDASPFLDNFGSLHCTALFLDNRLNLTNTADNFPDSHPPRNTIQALHLNPKAKEDLTREISSVFQRGIWLDYTSTRLQLLLSDDSTIPSDRDLREAALMRKYRNIESEGDGMRTYTAICLALLLGQTPLCLIDEPEMCLHPPQAYRIGRFIGGHKPNTEGCVVLATHSSQVLRGILAVAPDTTVIRLRRRGARFEAKKVDSSVLREATSKPRSKSENILDGMLSDAVVVCEGDGDRVVYESAYRSLSATPLDLRFVPVYGGAFAEPLHLYRALGVPSAAIADIDVLSDPNGVIAILTALGVTTGLPELRAEVGDMADRIKRGGPGITVHEAKGHIRELMSRDWDAATDKGLARELRKIGDQLSRFGQLKRQGTKSIVDERLRLEVESLLVRLKRFGLFLVPVGELECWLPTIMNDVSKEKKALWASTAAARVEELTAPPEDEDIWQFVREVLEFCLSS